MGGHTLAVLSSLIWKYMSNFKKLLLKRQPYERLKQGLAGLQGMNLRLPFWVGQNR